MQQQKNPMNRQLESNDLDYWYELLNSTEIDTIPLEIISELKFYTYDNEIIKFPVGRWVESGVDIEKIKKMISNWLDRQPDEVQGREYNIDMLKIKDIVQEKTEDLYKVLD